MPACRHCGSPARGNPCWAEIKFPGITRGGGDPPCECDRAAEEWARVDKMHNRKIGLSLAAVILLVTAAFYFS